MRMPVCCCCKLLRSLESRRWKESLKVAEVESGKTETERERGKEQEQEAKENENETKKI